MPNESEKTHYRNRSQIRQELSPELPSFSKLVRKFSNGLCCIGVSSLIANNLPQHAACTDIGKKLAAYAALSGRPSERTLTGSSN